MVAGKKRMPKALSRGKYLESESSDEMSQSDGGSSESEDEFNSDKPEYFFFACELSSENREYIWDHTEGRKLDTSADESVIDPEDQDVCTRRLGLRQVCLGPDAKPGERNIIAIETLCGESKEQKTIPIASLSVGVHEMFSIEMDFHSDLPVTMKLITGSGPVSVSGIVERELQYSIDDLGELIERRESPSGLDSKDEPSEVDDDDEEEDGDEESMEQDEDEEQEDKQKQKKKKTMHVVSKSQVSIATKKLKEKIKSKQKLEKARQQMS